MRVATACDFHRTPSDVSLHTSSSQSILLAAGTLPYLGLGVNPQDAFPACDFYRTPSAVSVSSQSHLLPSGSEVSAEDVQEPSISAQDKEQADVCASPEHPHEWEMMRWACVLAYFIIQSVTSGLLFAFGVIETAMLAALPGIGQSSIAAVGAVSIAVLNISAVGAGLIISRFGETKACILGGITAGFGLLLSSCTEQAWGLIASYGGNTVHRAWFLLNCTEIAGAMLVTV